MNFMDGWALAVDIGTASVTAVVRERGKTEIVDFAGRPTLPAAVFCPDGQPPLAGLPAMERAASEPGRAVLSPKRALAEGDTVTVGGTALPLTQVFAAILAEVARAAARGREPAFPDRLVLTYPAAREGRELAVLRAAAHEAGLPVPEIVPEPIAAAWQLAADARPGQLVAIFEVGSSIDAAVLRRNQDRFEFAGPPGGLARADDDTSDATLRRGIYELLATINSAGLTPHQLTAIHVTGDGSRAPGVADLIVQVLGVRPHLASSPGTATVRGAATAALGQPARQVSGRRIPRRTTPAAAAAAPPQDAGSPSRRLQCLVPRRGKHSFSVAALAAAAIAVTLLVLITLLLPHEHSAARPGPAHAEPASAVAAPAELYSVSCATLTACIAVGITDRDVAAAGTEALAERWNGTNWTIQSTPDPPGLTGAEFHGVSCTSPSACIAVGGSDYGPPLAERWNGTNWTIQSTPDPPGLTGAEFHGVSCTSPSSCIAVGGSINGPLLAERWNGTNWAIQPTPAPPGRAGSDFYGVSCTSPSACIAVGGSPGGGPPLAERWNGTNWTIQPTPDSPGLISSTFYGVSCTSPTACTAVGNTNETPMAERWNGVNWTTQHVPVQSAIAIGFGSVSCSSPTECTAVGPDDTFPYGLAAARWNGVQWATTPALQPAGDIYSGLYGVSCTSPTACTAVGQSGNSIGTTDMPRAESWNGTSWTIQHPPAPAWIAPPVLYSLDSLARGVANWDYPEIRPATFSPSADGSAALTGMHWARWNDVTAITSSATYYDRSGPCCTNSDQHYYKVTVTLSGVQYDPEPYFSRMTITGPGFRPLTYTYKTSVSGGTVYGAWT